jgi:hypothetical protein
MSYPAIALSVEGISDARFLIPFITRLVTDIFLEHGESAPLPIINLIEVPKDADRLINAAMLAENNDILVFHADCDNRNLLETREQFFEPGKIRLETLRPTLSQNLPEVVALLPKYEIETWLLADTETFLTLLRQETKSGKTIQELNLPASVRDIESLASPKERLKEAVKLSLENRSKRLRANLQRETESNLYVDLAGNIRFNILEQLESYRAFKDELTEALRKLNFIR